MTKKENFAKLIEVVNGAVMNADEKDECLKFLNHQIELLDNKNSSSKPSKTQRGNEEFCNAILSALTSAGHAVTVTELMNIMPDAVATSEGDFPVTNQKVSALLRQLKLAGKVVRTEEKKKAYFAIAE